MKKAFTLLELIIVIVILGILATLGFTQYTKVVEKGRTAEAKVILGQLRTAEITYKLDYGVYTNIANLAVDAPASCVSTNYFVYSYSTNPGNCPGNTPYLYAGRCTAGGKSPNASSVYALRLCIETGVFITDMGP
ncbi:MAG: prepilin-type N-terminal cleavage/methylation domain-containing protein [Candidatus Omnitrophica bacterium]|nr:prepilin-type N-terminal cleavage/methylation domain-containing protein [Candidatus Omnitrophota bacterium]